MATKKNNTPAENVNNVNAPVVEVEVEVTATPTPTAETPKKAKAKKPAATKKEEKKASDKKVEQKPKKEKATKKKKEETKPAPVAEETPKKEKVVKDKKNKKETETPAEPIVAVKAPKDGSLASMILAAARSKYPYRNEKGMTMIDAKTRKKLSDEEYAEVSRHRDVCQELVRLSTENANFPYTALVYFAVGSDAHKKPVFDKGYKTIDVSKAETILRWLRWFANYNKNPKFYTCEKIVHALAKLYAEYSKKDKDFKALMNKFEKMPAKDGYKASRFKTMKQFYDLLTKPLIVTAEVDENGNETIVSVEPNPLVTEAAPTPAVASCDNK